MGENLQTVAGAVEQTTSSVGEILSRAHRAARMAEQAVAVSRRTNTTIEALGSSSDQIGGVIRMIVKIAEQTNLLALNATIEASRAGAAGKGFGVVANEVKELARETAEATGEIGTRVTDIQAKTGEAVQALGQVGSIVEQINDLQSEIAASVEEQTSISSEMAFSVARAAESGMNIAESIEGVAAAAQEAAEGTGQMQEAAERLAAMAAKLQDFVAQFKLAESSEAGKPLSEVVRALQRRLPPKGQT